MDDNVFGSLIKSEMHSDKLSGLLATLVWVTLFQIVVKKHTVELPMRLQELNALSNVKCVTSMDVKSGAKMPEQIVPLSCVVQEQKVFSHVDYLS
jgi:hypothetical protein